MILAQAEELEDESTHCLALTAQVLRSPMLDDRVLRYLGHFASEPLTTESDRRILHLGRA